MEIQLNSRLYCRFEQGKPLFYLETEVYDAIPVSYGVVKERFKIDPESIKEEDYRPGNGIDQQFVLILANR